MGADVHSYVEPGAYAVLNVFDIGRMQIKRGHVQEQARAAVLGLKRKHGAKEHGKSKGGFDHE